MKKKRYASAEEQTKGIMMGAQEHDIDLGAGCGCSGCDYRRILKGMPSVYGDDWGQEWTS